MIVFPNQYLARNQCAEQYPLKADYQHSWGKILRFSECWSFEQTFDEKYQGGA